MKILILSGFTKSLKTFRGELVESIVSRNHELVAAGPENDEMIRHWLEDLGATFVCYPVSRNSTGVFHDIMTLFRLYKLFSFYKPDLILAYTIKPVIWGGIAARFMKKPRFFAMITGLGYAFQGGSFRRNVLMCLVVLLYRFSLDKADKVFFQNRDNMRLFIDNSIIPENKAVLINGSGVNLDVFREKTIPVGGFVFLSIGRLLGDKGFREYAKAAEFVKETYPEVRFQILGPTDPSPDAILEIELEEWRINGAVEYLGSADDVKPFIEACNVFVLPSYHEGLPRTVIEAMSMARPILTTDVPGCRETVVHEYNGLLVEAKNSTKLAESMIWFIENHNELERMGRNSRLLAGNRFDVVKVNEAIMRELDV